MSSAKKSEGTTPEKSLPKLPDYFYTSPSAAEKAGGDAKKPPKVHSTDCASVHSVNNKNLLNPIASSASAFSDNPCKSCKDKEKRESP